MTRKQRGTGLLLVLVVSAFVFVVGSALAVLCSISLNFASQMGMTREAEMLARAAVSQVMFEMDQKSGASGAGQSLNDFIQQKYGLSERYQGQDVFSAGGGGLMTADDRSSVSVTFNRAHPWYSIDNLASDAPCAGWRDEGGVQSVPPLSIDLIVNVKVGAQERHFEAVISSSWPFATYCVDAPIWVGGGSQVKGSLYSGQSIRLGDDGVPCLLKGDACVLSEQFRWEPGTVEQKQRLQLVDTILLGPSSTQQGKKRYRVAQCRGMDGDPSSLLHFPFEPAQMEKARLQAVLKALASRTGVDESLLVGKLGKTPDNETGVEDVGLELPTTIAAGLPVSPIAQDVLIGVDALYEYLSWPVDNPAKLSKSMGKDQSQGPKFYTREGRLLTFQEVHGTFNRLVFPGKLTPNADGSVAPVKSPSSFLAEDVVLENGYFSSHPLFNHLRVRSVPGGSDVADDISTRTGITINNAVLIVMGDLDISGLSGNNGTIFVTGNLFLNGGRLDAQDKGLLILANNVVMQTRGDFRGLIGAKGTMILNPLRGDDRLTVRGGLIAGGRPKYGFTDPLGRINPILPDTPYPLCLSNIDLLHDSRYTQALNLFASAQLRLFREIR